MFIEDQVETELLNWLSYIYQKTDTRSIMYIVYLRSCIYYNKNKITNEELCDFILYELNLPSNFLFNGIKISTISRYSDNSLLNIIDNLVFRYLETSYNDIRRGSISGKEFILELFDKHIRNAKNKTRSIKYYDKQFLTKYFALQQLYDEFNLIVQPPKRFDEVYYPENYNLFIPTLDELCTRHFDTYKIQEEKLIEKELEDYIYKNGLFNIKMLHRQFKIKNGIIDLIGIDENNQHVLIELKVISKPRDLLWQISLYQNEIKEHFKINKHRTIVVCPSLDKTISSLLPKDCEIITFKKNKSNYTFKKEGMIKCHK